MWILSSDGDFLHDKRVWLKPGKKYLFGRVKNDGVCHAIDHKSISRQHLIIEVGKVQPGDGSRIHARSKLVLTDQSSKGTTVDGEQLHGSSKEVGDREQYAIKLGRYPLPLRIQWCPIVLSFSFPQKELKAKDPLAHARSRLEDLDIKTVIPYVDGKTTHIVQNKRNTAKGLQALVNGKYIVEKSYIEAIVYAATPTELEAEEALCPLEEDFDSFWPDPVSHLPPRGKEPTEMPDSAYQPDASRSNVFEGYTFVFCDNSRFEDLQGPITCGHGKALLYEVDSNTTTAADIVDYMKRAGGNKGLALENDGTGGVLLVQFQGSRGQEDWAKEIQHQVSQLTGQKLVEPSEFLDAILRKDASNLCKPISKEPSANTEASAGDRPTDLRRGSSSLSRPSDQPRSVATAVDTVEPASADAGSALEETQNASRPVKRSRTRTYVPKFKNFDDGFDIDSIPVYTLEEGDGEATQEATQGLVTESAPAEGQQDRGMSEEDEMVTELLPGAAAMKQRQGGKRRRDPTPPPEPQKKPKRPKLDVKEAARQRREAEDKAVMARKQEDAASFQAMAEGMDLTQLQNLVIVEEMPVQPKEPQAQPEIINDARWDEKWNGRKNFKKFRRKGGADRAMQQRTQPVIIPVEVMKRKDHGLGDRFLSTNRAASESRRTAEPASQTAPASQVAVSQGSLQPRTTRARKRCREPDSSNDDDGPRFRFTRKKR